MVIIESPPTKHEDCLKTVQIEVFDRFLYNQKESQRGYDDTMATYQATDDKPLFLNRLQMAIAEMQIRNCSTPYLQGWESALKELLP